MASMEKMLPWGRCLKEIVEPMQVRPSELQQVEWEMDKAMEVEPSRLVWISPKYPQWMSETDSD